MPKYRPKSFISCGYFAGNSFVNLTVDLQQAEEELAAHSPGFAPLHGKAAPTLALAEAAAALPPKTALLQYAFLGEEILAWAIVRDGMVEHVIVSIDESVLTRKIRAFHEACSRRHETAKLAKDRRHIARALCLADSRPRPSDHRSVWCRIICCRFTRFPSTGNHSPRITRFHIYRARARCNSSPILHDPRRIRSWRLAIRPGICPRRTSKRGSSPASGVPRSGPRSPCVVKFVPTFCCTLPRTAGFAPSRRSLPPGSRQPMAG